MLQCSGLLSSGTDVRSDLAKSNAGRAKIRQVKREEWTLPVLKADLATAPADPIRKYRAVFAEGKGVAWPKADSYNSRKKIETTSVAQWIEQHLRLWAGRPGKPGAKPDFSEGLYGSLRS